MQFKSSLRLIGLSQPRSREMFIAFELRHCLSPARSEMY